MGTRACSTRLQARDMTTERADVDDWLGVRPQQHPVLRRCLVVFAGELASAEGHADSDVQEERKRQSSESDWRDQRNVKEGDCDSRREP